MEKITFKNFFYPRTLAAQDWFVLKSIQENPKLGTIDLAKKIGISPKNLIARLNIYKSQGWIVAESVAIKPKGAIRVHRVTASGIQVMEKFKEALDLAEENSRLGSLAAKKLGKKHIPLPLIPID